MQNQPSTFRFSLRALFVCTAFVGLGLLALKYPSDWLLMLVNLAVAFSIVYALISAWVNMGGHRLFWGAYAATAVTLLISKFDVPETVVEVVWSVMHSGSTLRYVNPFGELVRTATWFARVLDFLFVLAISSVAAYIIPWLVQRGQKKSRD